MIVKRHIAEKIKLEDLPDHLKRLGLTVKEVELWQRRGWLLWTEKVKE